MTPSRLQSDHQVLKKALGVVLLIMLMRMFLTLGDSALFCTTPSANTLVRTLLFDILTLIGLPLLALTYQEVISTRARIGAITIIITGFLLYETIRNSCAVPFFDR
ncbi:MAG TPA: hypothetical protein VFS21_07940 [Roseiflexaceae bacterium]|nr:hypothetical protein [Roseiflexaceae bacterium]